MILLQSCRQIPSQNITPSQQHRTERPLITQQTVEARHFMNETAPSPRQQDSIPCLCLLVAKRREVLLKGWVVFSALDADRSLGHRRKHCLFDSRQEHFFLYKPQTDTK